MQLMESSKDQKLYLVVDNEGNIIKKTYSYKVASQIAYQNKARIMKQENLFKGGNKNESQST